MKAILLVSHGSKEPKAREEIEALIPKIKKRNKTAIVKSAFLEIESPDIPQGIHQCIAEGATRVIILLNFLNSGRHAGIDIPQIVRRESCKYPGVKFSITKPIAQADAIIEIFLKLIDEQTDAI